MSEFESVCRAEDLPEGSAREFRIRDSAVAVFNIGGTFFACNDHCPHAGFSLAEGDITGCTVTCFGHGWTFDLRTGECAQVTSAVETYPVEVVDGVVRVALSPSDT